MELLQLFLISFLAGSILPFPSEAYLLFLKNSNSFSDLTLLGISSVGNTFGAIVNFYFGRKGSVYILKKFYGMGEPEVIQASERFRKYGHLAAFFSFVPFVGDPLTVAAGAIGYPVSWFIPLVLTGKLLRYIAVLGIFKTIFA